MDIADQQGKLKQKVSKANKRINRLVLQISDTGIGMPANEYQEVFVSFVRIGASDTSNVKNTDNVAIVTSDTAVRVESHSDTYSAEATTKSSINAFTKCIGLRLAIVYQICQHAGIDLYLSATNDEKNANSGLTVTLVF